MTGNVIEDAPTAGIMLGFGEYLRDVAVTGNVVRKADIGIAVSVAPGAGNALIANNMIADVLRGADHRHRPAPDRHRRPDQGRRRALRQPVAGRQPGAVSGAVCRPSPSIAAYSCAPLTHRRCGSRGRKRHISVCNLSSRHAMRLSLRKMLTGLLALFLLPLAAHAALYASKDRPASFRQADWSSVGMLPPANADRDARLLVLTGRTGRWKGIFAVHSWVVLKPENATTWTRYDVVGWGQPVRTNGWAPDARWFGDTPQVLLDVRGAAGRGAHSEGAGHGRRLRLPRVRRLSGLARPQQQHLHRRRAARGAGTAGRRCRRTRSARISATGPMRASPTAAPASRFRSGACSASRPAGSRASSSTSSGWSPASTCAIRR